MILKNFCSCLEEVFGLTSADSSPLLSADGTKLISEKDKHFYGVLNRPSSINDKAIKRPPQVPVNESLDVTPTQREVQIAILQLSSGKAHGSDSIPAEINKEGGSAQTALLLTLF